MVVVEVAESLSATSAGEKTRKVGECIFLGLGSAATVIAPAPPRGSEEEDRRRDQGEGAHRVGPFRDENWVESRRVVIHISRRWRRAGCRLDLGSIPSGMLEV